MAVNGLHCIAPREIVKPRVMEVYDIGIHAKRAYRGWWMPTATIGGERGRITEFSFAACRRLRAAMMTRYVPGVPVWSLTLTMPGTSDRFPRKGQEGGGTPAAVCPDGCADAERNAAMAECFRVAYNLFRKTLRYHFPEVAAIYRVELQKKSRVAPHIHALVWADDYNGLSAARVRARVSELWCEACTKCGWGDYNREWHWFHGAQWDAITDRAGLIRYVADHASKHKESQLGYQGKQWGYINQKRLAVRPHENVESERMQILIARAFGMLRRYRVKDSRCAFGWRHSPYHIADRGYSYASPSTVARLVEWARAEADER